MALIRCPECGREVSEAAVACPGCGYPIAAGAVRPGEKTPEPSRPTKPTNKDLGSGDPAPDWSDPLKIHRPDLLKIHKQDSRRNPGESIRATHPASADHWDDGGVNEGVWPEDVVLSLDGDLVVGWKPPCGHQFPMRIKYWIDNPGCPTCAKRFEDPKLGVIATLAEEVENEGTQTPVTEGTRPLPLPSGRRDRPGLYLLSMVVLVLGFPGGLIALWPVYTYSVEETRVWDPGRTYESLEMNYGLFLFLCVLVVPAVWFGLYRLALNYFLPEAKQLIKGPFGPQQEFRYWQKTYGRWQFQPGIATVAVTREQKRWNRTRASAQQALKYQPSWRSVPQVVCPHCQHRGSVQQLMPPAEADLDRAVRGALANALGYGESARRRSMGEAAYAAEKLKASLTEINMKCSKCSMQWHA